MEVTVLNNQSLLDVAIQSTGMAENFLKIAMVNNLVPTDFIAPGTILTVPDDIEKDETIVNYYNVNNIVPATAYENNESSEILGGIGTMKIGTTFTVR